MSLVDSHCHIDQLTLANFEGGAKGVVKAANDAGVSSLLCVCIDLENFPDVLAISEAFDCVNASVGKHPNATEGVEPTVEQLVSLAQHEKVIAIGETGLDFFRTEKDTAWQTERFVRHVEAAKKSALPLIIHTRDAKDATIAVLQAEGASRVGGVLHCFTEDWPMAKAGLDLGFYVSFSGIVTFKNATQIQEVAKKIPIDRLLVETDAPYLAPVPFRGKENQPAYVTHTAKYIADLRGISYDELARKTTENFSRCFNVPLTH